MSSHTSEKQNQFFQNVSVEKLESGLWCKGNRFVGVVDLVPKFPFARASEVGQPERATSPVFLESVANVCCQSSSKVFNVLLFEWDRFGE